MDRLSEPPRPPLLPFTHATAAQKVRLAEDAWNTRDPRRVSLAYTLAKSRPGALDFASGGMGSQQHVAMEFFCSAIGTHLHHVSFRGPAQAVIEGVGERIPMMFVALSIAYPFIQDGKHPRHRHRLNWKCAQARISSAWAN